MSSRRVLPKPIFGKGIDFKYNTIHAKGNFYDPNYLASVGVSDDIVQSLYLNVGKEMENLLSNFASGNMDEVAAELTLEKYEDLALRIYNERIPNKEYYEGIRMTMASTLEGLYKAILLYADYLIQVDLYNQERDRAAILDDVDALTAYVNKIITERRTTTNFYTTQTVYAMNVTLKPVYAEYLRRYGYPDGGVFEVDKLAQIELELGTTT